MTEVREIEVRLTKQGDSTGPTLPREMLEIAAACEELIAQLRRAEPELRNVRK